MADTIQAASAGLWAREAAALVCVSCHATGQSMTAVATWASGERRFEMYCDDVWECQQRAVPELAAALNGRALAPHAWTHPVTGPDLLAPLTRSQVSCLHARLVTAGHDLHELLYGENSVAGDQRAGLEAVQEDLRGLRGDTLDAMDPASEREIGAEVMAAARERNRLADVAKARELLAAEDQAGAS